MCVVITSGTTRSILERGERTDQRITKISEIWLRSTVVVYVLIVVNTVGQCTDFVKCLSAAPCRVWSAALSDSCNTSESRGGVVSTALSYRTAVSNSSSSANILVHSNTSNYFRKAKINLRLFGCRMLQVVSPFNIPG